MIYLKSLVIIFRSSCFMDIVSLKVYPGFAVSVDEQEDGLMICLDTQHRVLRTQNAYELLNEIQCAEKQRFKEVASSSIIGSCIFTRYNNKTYIVDDIAWDMNPQDTFPTRDGGSISFVDYYKLQYGITIKDVRQPLLINRRSVKVSGQTEKVERMVCLIPELSFLTGLTDAMRSDFKVKIYLGDMSLNYIYNKTVIQNNIFILIAVIL